MTTTYDPDHPSYHDEPDLRDEQVRALSICAGCRQCLNYCGVFPPVFALADSGRWRLGDPLGGDDAAEHATANVPDDVADELSGALDACHQCGLCVTNCPYAPGRHERALDIARLVQRTRAVKHRRKAIPLRGRLALNAVGRLDRVGKVASRATGIVNPLLAAPGSLGRKVIRRVTGISSQRVLLPYAKTRFSTWFKRRPRIRFEKRQGSVALFATCIVEYQVPAVGHDAVRVLERNGVECGLVDNARCCGAPSLHGGDIERFRALAQANVAAMQRAIRAGRDVVVLQPTCAHVIKKDYLNYLAPETVEPVVARTFDVSEYLMKVHAESPAGLDLDFDGDAPASITYHAPCHVRTQGIGLKSRDLLRLTGATVRVVAQCAGIDGMWGLSAANDTRSRELAIALFDAVNSHGSEVVAGDCALAHGAIVEGTGRVPVHPIQVIARAYGIPEEPIE